MILRRGDIVSDCGHIDSGGRPQQEVRVYRMNGDVIWEDGTRIRCDWIIACVPCVLRAGGVLKKIDLLAYPAPHDGPDIDMGETMLIRLTPTPTTGGR
jgi:hypothetical protein